MMGLKRNLIIVLAHGMRSDSLDDSQCWPLHTPNLHKVMDRGVRLSASSACPADGGGMMSLLTGLHARQHGFVQQESITAKDLEGVGGGWPALLVESGYHMAGVGCVAAIEPWLDQVVRVESVDEVGLSDCSYMTAMERKGMVNAMVEQRLRRRRQGPFDPIRLLIDSHDDVDGFIAAQAHQLVTQLPSNKPWALVVIFSGPANDLPPPTLFETIVDHHEVEQGFLPADFKELDDLAELDYPRILLQRLNPQGLGMIRADYLGRVSLIDYGVGRLETAAKKRPDHDRTWLLFSSDRGQLLGEHGLIGHRSFLAGSIKVPVIIAPPNPVEQKVYPDLISTVDVAATITALGACDELAAGVGRSLLPVLTNRSVQGARSVSGCISEFSRRLMHESERYKVVFDTDSSEAICLFDRHNDDQDQKNLVGKPVALNVVDSLRHRVSDALLPLRAAPGGIARNLLH